MRFHLESPRAMGQNTDEIEPEMCHNLISSMPIRMEAVIREKGGDTKYVLI